jgi:hypothetical protein
MSFLYGEPILCIPRKFVLVILLLSNFENIKCVLVKVDFICIVWELKDCNGHVINQHHYTYV